MAEPEQVRPLIRESSTAESTNVSTIMDDLRDEIVRIPDYQRDSDQWDDTTKSLFIESIINNLSVPAFFLEPKIEDGIEKNEVVDGQQRLTTLFDFHRNKFRLVESDEAPYLSPNSLHYAAKTLDELPETYRRAFRNYRLPIIKLRDLGDTRLEVFRRINRGGTPLSGQDIRLAVYGTGSPTGTFIRLAGIYAPERQASERFIKVAMEKFKLSYPWRNAIALKNWREWWEDKDIALGQTPSEMFLWSLACCQVEKLDTLLGNDDALRKLNCRFSGAIDEALDIYCAQTKYQDQPGVGVPALLMELAEMQEKFFPRFQEWISTLLVKGPSLPVRSYRTMAAMIGAAYEIGTEPKKLTADMWNAVIEFIRTPPGTAKKLGVDWPLSKGRWVGLRGYKAQFIATREVWKAILM